MASFAKWLNRILEHGDSALDGPVDFGDAKQAAAILDAAFARHRLDVAGPPIEFHPQSAIAAAKCLADACWRLVSPEPVVGRLGLPGEPRTPAEHLSGDVMLRFLPAIYRRASASQRQEVFLSDLADVFRTWPLSGVLVDLDDPPVIDPAFDGHAGLQLLFAERLLRHPRATWIPADSMARQRVEMVFVENQRELPTKGPETLNE